MCLRGGSKHRNFFKKKEREYVLSLKLPKVEVAYVGGRRPFVGGQAGGLLTCGVCAWLRDISVAGPNSLSK